MNVTTRLKYDNGTWTPWKESGTSEDGFKTTAFVANSRNPIWRFGNSDNHGFSYFQGGASRRGQDSIGVHFGTPTDAASTTVFTPNGIDVPNKIIVGLDATLPEHGYNIGTPAYGGAIELRGHSGTTNRGWRLGLRDSGTGFYPTLRYIEGEQSIYASANIAIESPAPTIQLTDTDNNTSRAVHSNLGDVGFLKDGSWLQRNYADGTLWTSKYGNLENYFASKTDIGATTTNFAAAYTTAAT
jgi:hypothetical protein